MDIRQNLRISRARRGRRSTFAFAAASTLLLLLLAASSATAAPNKGVGAPTPPIPYDLFAVVNANGTLARGTPGTTVSHPGPGQYDVRFAVSVDGCSAVANLGYPGMTENFTFPAAVTATAGRGAIVFVDVTFPGDIPFPGGFPNRPVLRDNSFHLHVDCRHALYANVAANGTLMSASPGVTATAHVAGSGQYHLNFGRDISQCAPTATVHTDRNAFEKRQRKSEGSGLAVQAYLALGADSKSTSVSVNASTTAPVDHAFSLVVTCGEQPSKVFPVSGGFYNLAPVPEAILCALTANWYNSTAGGVPSNQGYVSTWAFNRDTATVQTKNGGYGVQPGFGVDIVASC